MQIKTSDGGTSNVASQGLGVWGAVGGGLGTLALLNQGFLGGNGIFGNRNNGCGCNQDNDTRQISALESKIAKLAERYTNRSKTWSYDTFKQVFDELGLSTQDKKYSCYDVNFVATLKYLIHCNTLNPLNATAKTYIKMALDELNLDSEYAYKHYEELQEKYS